MSKINWHRYPETKPSRDDRYMVTTNRGLVDVDRFSEDGIPFEYFGCQIIAWAELPEPYDASTT